MCRQTQWSYHFKRRKTHINHTEIWQSTPNTFDWIWKLTPLWNTICFTSLIESTDRDDTHDPPSRRNLTVFTKTALIGKRDVSYHDISPCGTKQAQFLASNIHIDSSPSSLFCEFREVMTQGSTCDFHIRTIVLCQISLRPIRYLDSRHIVIITNIWFQKLVNSVSEYWRSSATCDVLVFLLDSDYLYFFILTFFIQSGIYYKFRSDTCDN